MLDYNNIKSSKDIEVENATWDLISADDKEDFEYVIEHRDMKLEKRMNKLGRRGLLSSSVTMSASI